MAQNILLTSLSAAGNDLPLRYFSFQKEFGFDYCDALLDAEAGIKAVLARYDIDEIIIAMPTASKKVIREILEICKQTKCELKTLPGMYQLVNGEVNVSQLRKVDIADLLGRDQVQIDLDSVMSYVKDKVILVTGGGGSIGSELCRQIATHRPKQLIIFDIYENSAYAIQQELKIVEQ